MNKSTVLLTIFAIIAVGSLVFMISSVNAESSGITHVVELRDGVSLSDSITLEHYKEGCILDWCPSEKIAIEYVPSISIGDIVKSEDGTHCWIVTEFGTTFHYKLLGEC